MVQNSIESPNISLSPDVSPIWIIIVNYHSQDLVCRCIESLKKFIPLPFKVFVTDNSQAPDTHKISEKFPEITIERAANNRGFAAGCNIGIKHALNHNAEYVLLLNPDTYATQDFVTPMYEAFQKNPKLGMAGPTIFYDVPSNKIWMAGSTMNWMTGGASHIFDERYLHQTSPISVPFMSGCAMMLRSDAIKDVGLVDERYFLYFEDADYCQAFISNNWEIAYIPYAKLIHAASSTTGFQSESYVYYFARNRIWFMKRWSNKIEYMVFMLFTIFVKIPGAFIVFGVVRRTPKLTFAFLRGFIDGIKKG